MIDSLYYARGQIWNRTNGREEEGKSVLKKRRPVIIVSNNIGNVYSGVVTVVPLTTSERLNELQTQVELKILGKRSWALCEQMYCTSKDNLGSYIGTVSFAKMQEIDDAIRFSVATDLELQERNRNLSEVDCNKAASDVSIDVIQALNNDTDSEIITDKVELSKEHRRSRTRYTDESKLDLLIKVEDNLNASREVKASIAKQLGFSSWSSLTATARRFRKEVESE